MYFEEFANFTMTQWICFPLGCFITIYGVWVLSSREMQHDVSYTYNRDQHLNHLTPYNFPPVQAGAPPVPPAPPSTIADPDLAPDVVTPSGISSSHVHSCFEPEFCPVKSPAQVLQRASSIGTGPCFYTSNVVVCAPCTFSLSHFSHNHVVVVVAIDKQ